jgi:hypothetical protein
VAAFSSVSVASVGDSRGSGGTLSYYPRSTSNLTSPSGEMSNTTSRHSGVLCLSKQRSETMRSGPPFCPYSPKCLVEVFSEV